MSSIHGNKHSRLKNLNKVTPIILKNYREISEREEISGKDIIRRQRETDRRSETNRERVIERKRNRTAKLPIYNKYQPYVGYFCLFIVAIGCSSEQRPQKTVSCYGE